jgi:DNA invertase Pin-like site-specific DNA recombinase
VITLAGINSSTPVTGNGMAKLFFTMLSAFAEFERDRISERIADGKHSKADDGGALGGKAPFGWRKIGSGKESMLEEVPEEQTVIADMKQWRESGQTLRAMAARVSEEHGIKLSPEVRKS